MYYYVTIIFNILRKLYMYEYYEVYTYIVHIRLVPRISVDVIHFVNASTCILYSYPIRKFVVLVQT